jgi:hypothetical protein
METLDTHTIATNSAQIVPLTILSTNEKPVIYDYVDYRAFLSDSLNFIQTKNSKYSATAFVRQAGFGENSRGYFNLIMSGTRNLRICENYKVK